MNWKKILAWILLPMLVMILAPFLVLAALAWLVEVMFEIPDWILREIGVWK